MNNHIKLLNNLYDIYEDRLIYRTIIVTNNIKDSIELYNILEDADYSALIVNEININIKYNEIEKRIVIITCKKFKKFIEHLNNKYGKDNTSYNLVLFSDNIDAEYLYDLECFYNNITNTNK